MSLTVGHVLAVALATVLGAGLGRFIRRRSRRLQYLKEVVRAALFLIGIAAAVALAAWSPGTWVLKSVFTGFYVGAVYGLLASEPRLRRGSEPHAPQKRESS